MLTKRCACPDKTKCRHPYWYAFVLHGTRYRKSTRTANRQTAARVRERRRIAILEGRDEEDQPQVTLKKHIEDYVAYTGKKNRTSYKDDTVLQRVLSSVGDRALNEVSPFHIERWKAGRAESVSRSTVNRELNIVRGCFSRGVEWGRIDKSPLDSVRTYKVDDQRVRVLNDTELRKVLGSPDKIVALICRVTLECLPRLSEVLALRPEHLGPTWMEVRRKGGSVERVAITQELRALLLERCEEFKGITQQAGTLRIVRELRRLGIQNASHHTMRHTGVTLMLEAGVNPRVIQKLAGWSSLRMLERYGHARDAEVVRAVTSNAAHLTALTTTAATEDSAIAVS